MKTESKKRAPKLNYVSPNQLTLVGFESPFAKNLLPENRWVVLAGLIPWDEISSVYLKQMSGSTEGRPPLNPRIVLGALIIKHICNLDDRETVAQISENVYMQYFLGYSSFSSAVPFDASLFVEIRKRLGAEQVNAINERILALKTGFEDSKTEVENTDNQQDKGIDSSNNAASETHKGTLLLDATAAPQDIAFPTDLNLLNEARQKSEKIIDILYSQTVGLLKKPRTYRKKARKLFLHVAQKRRRTHKEIRKAVGQQLRFLNRNLKIVDTLLDRFETYPLDARMQKYLMVLHTLYEQQNIMYQSDTHTIPDRIVSIHQPHVRPIVRGKSTANVEFGAKLHLSYIDGFSFLDQISWDAFNEGSHMIEYVENFRKRFGCYPREVLADQIYCTRANRRALKDLGIKLIAKPLGRPSAVSEHVRPGARNPIEGKFGQAKTAYGLNRIRARLAATSESWIATIILVLNLVRLTEAARLCQIFQKVILSISAHVAKLLLTLRHFYKTKINLNPAQYPENIYFSRVQFFSSPYISSLKTVADIYFVSNCNKADLSYLNKRI